MKRIIRITKNNAWYLFGGLGFAASFLSASASEGGAGLQYTIPAAITGCLMFCAGIAKGNQAAARRREAKRAAERKRSIRLMEDKHDEPFVRRG